MYERTVTPDAAVLYEAQREHVRELLDAAGPGIDQIRIPACPDWNVADLIGHLAGTAAALLARDYPGDDSQSWVDRHVAARRGRTANDNLAEWDEVGPAYEVLLRKNEVAWGPLLYDAVAHEHDLRHALGRPGGRDSTGVDYALDRALWQHDKKAAAAGIGSLRILSGADEWIIGDGEPVVVLRAGDRWELFRALGSRRSLAQLRAIGFDGDAARWIQLAPWDLPPADLVE